ncbi:MAG: ABC transporter ATP-binding protein, partial [Ferruginibacter sp.]
LQVKNLDINFSQGDQNIHAVKNISFNIQRGRLLALVGESGSGKSVTAMSLMQLLPNQAMVNGQLLFSIEENAMVNLASISSKHINEIRGKDIGMIFQEPMTSLNPVFTCGYQLMEQLIQHLNLSKAEAKQKAIELFTQVGLPDPAAMLNRYPHEISGGQKQRVMIAMAISCNPSLLIADEPTTALDVRVQKSILQLIKNLQVKNNMAVLLITHDLGLVAEVADDIAVMYKGEIVEYSDAKKILQYPEHPYTKALLACRPAANSKGKTLPMVKDFIEGEINIREEKIKPSNVIKNDQFLRVQNLSVHYGIKKSFFGKPQERFKAVDDVSFDIYKNETLGLVGESGCGKTTLGRAILQLIKPSSGNIYLQEKNLTAMPAETLRKNRKDFQIVFQDPYGSLNPRISIGQAILEPMKVHGLLDNDKQRKEKVMQLLGQVSLQDNFYNRYPHQFSGGQRQRICIARALALEPSFLVFDESVSALDVSVQAQVLNLINELKSLHQFTSLFISHDLAVVHHICDRIMVMQEGKIIEEGKADDVYYQPKENYTRQLIDAIPGKMLKTIN